MAAILIRVFLLCRLPTNKKQSANFHEYMKALSCGGVLALHSTFLFCILFTLFSEKKCCISILSINKPYLTTIYRVVKANLKLNTSSRIRGLYRKKCQFYRKNIIVNFKEKIANFIEKIANFKENCKIYKTKKNSQNKISEVFT